MVLARRHKDIQGIRKVGIYTEREREEKHGAALNYSFTISTFVRAATPSLLPPRCFHLLRKKETQVRELHYARIVAEPD